MSSNIKIDAFCPVGIGGTKGIDVSKLKLFVGGLPADLSSKDLFDIFSPFGAIREAVVIPDRFRVRSRCYGFLTFVNEQSARKVCDQRPICTRSGAKLTVVLASANSKPRRAHFRTTHGISGHKPLPQVAEEGEASTSSVSETNKSNDRRHGKKGKVSIYTDPSLFRTANIQSIAPAVFDIAVKPESVESESVRRQSWPNHDIKSDFRRLSKVTTSADPKQANDSEDKAWKLIAVESEIDTDSVYSVGTTLYYDCQDDDFYSTHSRKWKPINTDNMCTAQEKSKTMPQKMVGDHDYGHSPLLLSQNKALLRSTTNTVSTGNVQCMVPVGASTAVGNQSNSGAQTGYNPGQIMQYNAAQLQNGMYLNNHAFAYCLSDCPSNRSNHGQTVFIDPSASNYSLLSVPLNASVFGSIPLAYHSQSNFMCNNQ